METNNDRTKLVEDFLLDPQRVVFEQLEDFKISVDTLIPLLQGVDIESLTKLKGLDGKTPERGVDYFTDEDLDTFESFIIDKMPVADIDYPTVETVQTFINQMVEKVPTKQGAPGKSIKGDPGKDGSPDTGTQIIKKIRGLDKNKGLQIGDIRGLDAKIRLINETSDQLDELQAFVDGFKMVMPAAGSTGGGTGSSITLKTNGTNNGSQSILNLQAGTGISLTDNGSGQVLIENISSGGDVTGPASAVDGNVVFFDTTTGKLIKDSGLTLSGSNTGDQDLSGYELLSNKVTSISGASTDVEYPSAKLVYDQLAGKQATISFGTGVQTALGVNVGSAGAPVLFDGALGTPSSGTLTNATGTATGLTSGITNALKSATTTVDVSAATAPSSGQVLTATSSTEATWQTPSSGSSFWTTMPGTPTRVGNTSFTVTGDVTTYVAKGMIIKWTESSTVRVAMVSIPSTYGSPNTTITIIGDTMASIDSSSLKYAQIGAEPFQKNFAVAGTIGATGTNVANTYYATEPMRVIGADLQVGTVASTSGTTTVDINKNGTTFMTTKATLAYNVASSPTPFTADSATSFALGDKVTLDIDGVTSTTFPVDLYLNLYVFPTRYLSL